MQSNFQDNNSQFGESLMGFLSTTADTGQDIGQMPYLRHQNFDPHHPDGFVIGHPGREMHCWHHQSYPDDCGVVAQQMAIESMTGSRVSEHVLCWEAWNDGCYSPGTGTFIDHLGHLVEAETQVPVQQHYGGSFPELANKLADGERVFVAIDSKVEWLPDRGSVLGWLVPSPSSVPSDAPNHAIEVIGIVFPSATPSHPKVIVNDSGINDGRGMEVPLDQFDRAWSASDRFIASTNLHGDSLASNPVEGQLMSNNADDYLQQHLNSWLNSLDSSDSSAVSGDLHQQGPQSLNGTWVDDVRMDLPDPHPGELSNIPENSATPINLEPLFPIEHFPLASEEESSTVPGTQIGAEDLSSTGYTDLMESENYAGIPSNLGFYDSQPSDDTENSQNGDIPYSNAHPTVENDDFSNLLDPWQGTETHLDLEPNQTSHSQAFLGHGDNCPYTTINNDGLIYKHSNGASAQVGRITNRSVYNSSSYYLGYAGKDGNVYDNQQQVVGWVDSCGRVYNAGGHEVYETSKGVIGGAAYLLTVYLGGVN